MEKRNIHPPKLAQRFLQLFLKQELAEEVLGDLDEHFYAQNRSSFRAKLSYWIQVLNYLRPFAIKSNKAHSNYFIMYKHNLRITYRTMLKYKTSFLINIIGLSTGMACAFFIFLWMKDELSVNSFHKDDHLLYQVLLNHNENGAIRTGDATPYHLAEVLQAEYEEVELAVRDTDSKMFGKSFSFEHEGKIQKAEGKFSDPQYFDVFSFKFKHGNPQNALSSANSIVLTESLATKIFGSTENVIGKSLEWHILHLHGVAEVTGILYNLPTNTTESFEFVLPYHYYGDSFENKGWGNFINQTYVRLGSTADVAHLNDKINTLINEKSGASIAQPFLQQYASLYLHGKFDNGTVSGGRIEYIRLFGIVAAFVLIIACINFMNLTTARAARRVKEIGVKKSLGASRAGLIRQHLFEAIFLAFIALFIAIAMVFIFLPAFNHITDKHIIIPLDLQVMVGVIAITLITGLFAGSYPAFYLSRFKPVSIFKGTLKTFFKEIIIRKGMVVFQFALSAIFIISVFIVNQQVDYLQNRDLGYKKDNILKVPVEGSSVTKTSDFINTLKTLPEIENASAASHSMVSKSAYTTGVWWPGKSEETEVGFERLRTNGGIIKTLEISLKDGRGFSSENNDFDKIIFNETAVKVMGLKDPIGQKVKLWGEEKEIVGVVHDFHYSSLHDKIEPLFLHYDTTYLESIFIKVKGRDIRESIASITSFYKEINPGYSFDYEFLDQNYATRYAMEEKITTLSQAFAIMAIIISSLGLFGLAAFTTERRIKEVGIRKVFGAGTASLVKVLSSDFNKTLVLSVLIAVPITYYLISQWLNSYAYKIELQYWYFLVPAALALIISWTVVGIQSFRATILNPVDTLKSE